MADLSSVMAFDIETVPIPPAHMGERDWRRFRMQFRYQRGKQRKRPRELGREEFDALRRLGADPENDVYDHLRKHLNQDTPWTTANKSRSFHPQLGFVAAVGLAQFGTDMRPEATALIAENYEEEARLLTALWTFLGDPDREYLKRFISWNGKSFDSPWLQTRSLIRGIKITRTDILNTYPFGHFPHCDLKSLYSRGSHWLGLEDAAASIGIEMNADFRGDEMADRHARGDMQAIKDHVKEDALTTLKVFRHVADHVDLDSLGSRS